MSRLSKLLSMLAVLTIAYTGAYSADTSQIHEHFRPLPTLEEGCNTPARVNVVGSWDMFLKGDFLIWNVKRDNCLFARTSTQTYINPSIDGKGLCANPRWRPGVKVAVGGSFSHDDWTLAIEWTYMLGKSRTTATPPPGGYLMPTALLTMAQYDVKNYAEKIQYRSHQHYNVIDLNLGRPYYVGHSLVLSPFYGARAGWFRAKTNQTVTNLYIYGVDDTITTLEETNKARVWALGPRIGVSTDWLLGCGFRMFGNGAGCLAFTRGNYSDKATSAAFASYLRYSTDDVLGLSTRTCLLRPNFDGAIGLGWCTYFDNYNWHFDISLGYDFHYWLKILGQDSLTLHGGNIALSLDF